MKLRNNVVNSRIYNETWHREHVDLDVLDV